MNQYGPYPKRRAKRRLEESWYCRVREGTSQFMVQARTKEEAIEKFKVEEKETGTKLDMRSVGTRTYRNLYGGSGR